MEDIGDQAARQNTVRIPEGAGAGSGPQTGVNSGTTSRPAGLGLDHSVGISHRAGGAGIRLCRLPGLAQLNGQRI